MSNKFRIRIRKAIANTNLQIALDNNAQRRTAGRLSAFASMPDHEQRRQRARAVKAEVVGRMDKILEQFIEKASANGMIIHRARTADEAAAIIIKIIQQSTSAPHPLVAKSKSMVSEEIRLNEALESAGIRAVETDLGEYIVQLRGEHPSHIITPAVHLRRGDVGKLFEEKLGIPYTEEIPVLTNTARKVLRDVFLTADVGFSGVNFGVAETGTLVLVTNEGNGRMCTTVPPVHIALMGMERLVPAMDDLALFLSLLPRSATGQKLSVYTSLIHSPLPGQTRHLVLLDNGRSALRNSTLAESLYCIRCGACLNACPVFRELSGHAYGSIYPGPIGSVISSALIDPQYAYLSQASSLCGACKAACPVDIDLPSLLLRIRAGEVAITKGAKPEAGVGLPAPVKLGLKGFRLGASSSLIFSLGQRILGLGARLLSPRRPWMHLPAWTGWGLSKEFPRPAVKPFRARFHGSEPEETVLTGKPDQVAAESRQGLSEPDLVEQFASELAVVGGFMVRVKEKDLPGLLAEFLQARGVKRILVDEVGEKVASPLEALGISLIQEPDSSVKVGLTGTLAGIAETGSVVLLSGEGDTLKASLLPEVHIALLKRSQLLPTLEKALVMPEIARAASGVVVTGPSRTADIEMTLTIGVHGPGEIHVFLIDDL